MADAATIARFIRCTECGATTEAACSCNAPYVPAGERAAEAVAANPEKSDRAIAAELGVSSNTVRNARSTAQRCAVGETFDNAEPEKRIGRDGKARRMPQRKSPARKEPAANPADGKLIAARKEIERLTKLVEGRNAQIRELKNMLDERDALIEEAQKTIVQQRGRIKHLVAGFELKIERAAPASGGVSILCKRAMTVDSETVEGGGDKTLH